MTKESVSVTTYVQSFMALMALVFKLQSFKFFLNLSFILLFKNSNLFVQNQRQNGKIILLVLLILAQVNNLDINPTAVAIWEPFE